jgi:oxygen-independent coproporphyrinogen-3 oxidase
VGEARAAIDLAQRVFDRVSFDLIYARQNQSLAQWEAELRSALDFGVGHLSLYQLTIEPGTAFGDRFNRGLLRGLPDDELSADMFELTDAICSDAGLVRYEVSNHSREGQRSSHNMLYWNCDDYIGIGPGSHGRLTLDWADRYATETMLAPVQWLEAVEKSNGAETRERLSAEEQAHELLVMGLRTADGISLSRYRSIIGAPLSAADLESLSADGVISLEDDRLKIQPAFFGVMNAVLERLVSVQPPPSARHNSSSCSSV